MRIDSLFFNVAPGEVRTARVRDGRLLHLVVDRLDRKNLVGNIYLARVARVLPGLEAAFLDIGEERAAFLRLSRGGDGDRRRQFREGDALLVQVEKDAEWERGPRATTSLSLAGPYLVFTPNRPGIHVSRRIREAAERERLADLMAGIVGDGEGFIVRTPAAGLEEAAFRRESKTLRERWAEISEKGASLSPPALVEAELAPVPREIRDQADSRVATILIDDPRMFAEVEGYCRSHYPEVVDRLELYKEPTPLFERYDIETEIERLLLPRVDLPSGGELVIEEGEALTAIDVNSRRAGEEAGKGGFLLRTNLEAAEEIARQIRLRNLAGAILVDFIGMKRREHRDRVAKALLAASSDDPADVELRGFTRVGFAEITRKRARSSLSRILQHPCPACHGTGRTDRPTTLAYAALRQAKLEAAATPSGRLLLIASPEVVAALEGEAAEARRAFETETGMTLSLKARGDLPPQRFEFVPGKGTKDEG